MTRPFSIFVVKISVLMFGIYGLVACGQKGDLYLPETRTEIEMSVEERDEADNTEVSLVKQDKGLSEGDEASSLQGEKFKKKD